MTVTGLPVQPKFWGVPKQAPTWSWRYIVHKRFHQASELDYATYNIPVKKY